MSHGESVVVEAFIWEMSDGYIDHLKPPDAGVELLYPEMPSSNMNKVSYATIGFADRNVEQAVF